MTADALDEDFMLTQAKATTEWSRPANTDAGLVLPEGDAEPVDPEEAQLMEEVMGQVGA